jgi:hypothetical protein
MPRSPSSCLQQQRTSVLCAHQPRVGSGLQRRCRLHMGCAGGDDDARGSSWHMVDVGCGCSPWRDRTVRGKVEAFGGLVEGGMNYFRCGRRSRAAAPKGPKHRKRNDWAARVSPADHHQDYQQRTTTTILIWEGWRRLLMPAGTSW